jgi:cardiolipin synthase
MLNYLSQKNKISYLIASYLENTVGFSPEATGVGSRYFSCGEEFVAHLIHEMNNAKKYIFLEFFSIEKGILWESIQEILAQKAADGLDVRLICDAVGSFGLYANGLKRKLEILGIKVFVFNTASVNTRNHRKLASIDGKVAFCGGINLADQYINIKEMYGHFKDGGVAVDGATAWNMTCAFLKMWELLSKEKVDYSELAPITANVDCTNHTTLSQPMIDTPADSVNVAEHTLINLISRSQEYVYITTPYLMCRKGFLSVLYTAARSGIDVRIITPYIADKRLVKQVTESYYHELIENKVRIFEYTPGFIHMKSIISDGQRAMVGTVNLDERSLYCDHECGVCLFGGSLVDAIDSDFKETLAQCKEITMEQLAEVGFFKRVIQRVSRLFAPFL